MRDCLIMVAILLLVALTAVHTLFPAPPPLLVDATVHRAAAPFCTIPGPPKPLERDRRNPLTMKEMA